MTENLPWTGPRILQMMGGFREACVIAAAADLDVWSLLGDQALTVEEMARRMSADLRAATVLLDAVTALGFLSKDQGRYRVPEPLRPLLTAGTPQTVLPMLLHQANLVRSWSQLAQTVRQGKPVPRIPSIRGPEADRAAFIAAMHSVSGPIADELVAKLQPISFHHLLDVGGASGTWALAFLRIVPEAKATIFDLPDAVEQARERINQTPFARRITLVGGDFYTDDLPSGADFAWVSAIIHQHDRQHNRNLFAKVYRALQPGGRVAVRDIVMQPDRTQPRDGALFAVNMLVGTETGGTYTYDEIAADLQSAGFADPKWVVKDEGMQSVVTAIKST
ncbi:MAG: methyltransferase domain-containing protein [Pirellulales bacterium]|nr:methyltransferase domain-containing protein [Pirellulales bacterium]